MLGAGAHCTFFPLLFRLQGRGEDSIPIFYVTMSTLSGQKNKRLGRHTGHYSFKVRTRTAAPCLHSRHYSLDVFTDCGSPLSLVYRIATVTSVRMVNEVFYVYNKNILLKKILNSAFQLGKTKTAAANFAWQWAEQDYFCNMLKGASRWD